MKELIQQLEMNVSMEDMPLMKDFIFSVTSKVGMSDRRCQQMRLVVEEAVANIINYSGATTLTLSATHQLRRLRITITDNGTPFNPLEMPAPELNLPGSQRKPGGLGIHFIRQMSDDVAYRREGEQNILTITKLI